MTEATILFADVSGSSRLYKEQGDAVAKVAVAGIVNIMSLIVDQFDGEVIKTIGDEVMARFDNPGMAVRAAIEIQRRCETSPMGYHLPVRIGCNHGAIIEENQDVFGEAVNDAAALVKIAKPAQIVASSNTIRMLDDALKNRASRFDRIKIKGSDESTVIYLLDWELQKDNSNATLLVDAAHTDTIPPAAQMEIVYLGKKHVIDSINTPFVAGRDPAMADLLLHQGTASRDHFRIEFRRGKFVLIDNSTNGTTVFIGEEQPLYLRREELPLMGRGVIAIGKNPERVSSENLSFSC